MNRQRIPRAFCPLKIATLGVSVVLWLSSSAVAQEALLSEFHFRASNSAVNTRDFFQWPVTTDIDAVLRIESPAATSASVFLVVFDAGEVVAKHKEKFELTAGQNELRIPKVYATDRTFGQRLLTAQLELSVKGYTVEKREAAFEVKGPPMPKAEILKLRIYPANATGDPQAEESTAQFAVGQTFQVEVVFSVLDNPAKLKPRLILLGSMAEDDQYTGYDLPRQMYDDHYDIREFELETGEGVRRVIARGGLPHFFAEPWKSHHRFRIYAAVDFGSGPRVIKQIESDIFDYQPSEARRDDDPLRRLIHFARASSWSTGEPLRPMDGRPEPIE